MPVSESYLEKKESLQNNQMKYLKMSITQDRASASQIQGQVSRWEEERFKDRGEKFKKSWRWSLEHCIHIPTDNKDCWQPPEYEKEGDDKLLSAVPEEINPAQTLSDFSLSEL